MFVDDIPAHVGTCSAGGVVLLDGAASVSGHGAELAHLSGGKTPRN